MASHSAIRLAAKSTKSALRCIYLQCSVKPGTNKQREGVVSISDTVIELCVAAQPKDGAANLSVRKVFSDIFKCPKSDIKIIQGLKSQEKTVSISGLEFRGDNEKCISRIREQLESAVE
ncbi:hypothetical protein NA56DRAFT_711399 [Hyaloscypha hepaticicola]|uniref:YggU-like protein n=1 Tax=Hyaloscypha hepaticicola TaxID=2082293 RepID=A0A2J6PJ44_9HELO|nr:hypothetical protein NA56DRAFT_711399 [Hyaloscypha hepaticicola]